ncbi:MAG: MtnX-like HAD-IB family phosphatase [Endomicrobia bacterium]|nr:MtnX-like HAD-IB family phosphatase [Endomicrobiia bacterium]
MKKTALISDFDGTLSKEDFFNMVIDRLLSKDDIQPWQDYLAGRITHLEALSRIFAKVRIPQAELDIFIQSIEIDPKAEETFELCKELAIPIYICSAGMDYYILKKIPQLIEKYNITIVANKAEYSPETGFEVTPPPVGSLFYSKNTGIAKDALVESLKKQGFFTIFAGDGRPDIKAAKIADAVFAKSVLLNLCREQNIRTLKFDGFGDITEYIERRCGDAERQ